jgi:diguanylate cyclase (GGDEF)-like protein/PAS domain S-box-containing protein
MASFMKLQKKIFIVILGVTVAFLISGFSFSYYLSLRRIRGEIYNHLETAVQSRKHHVETFIEMMKGRMVDFSSDGYIRNCLSDLNAKRGGGCTPEDLTNHLTKNKLPAIEELVDVFALDARGNILASTDQRHIGQNKSHESYFTQGSKRPFMGDVYFSNIFKGPVMAVSAPLTEGDNFMGVIAGNLRPQRLYDIVLNRDGLRETGEVYVVNNDGYMITPSRFKDDVVLNQEVRTSNAQMCFAEAQGMMKSPQGMQWRKQGPVLAKGYRGVPVIGTHAYLPQTGWCLLAEIDEKEVKVSLYDLLLAFTALGAVFAFLAYLVSGWLADKISGPVLHLEQWARRISSEDWEHQAPIPIGSKDEIGELSKSFNRMVVQLRDSFGKLREEKQKLEESEDRVKKHLQRFQKLSEAGLLIAGDSREVFLGIAQTALDLVPARFACITEIVKGEELHMLCVMGGGGIVADVRKYPLVIAPCSQVHKTGDIVFCDNAVSQYPKLTFLKEYGVPFYCGIPAFNKTGEVIGVLCFFNDKRHDLSEEDKDTLRILAQRVGLEIEREQHGEEQRRNQEELSKLSLAIEQSPTSVLITDAGGVIEYVNAKFTEVSGYTKWDLAGKNIRFLKSAYMSEREYEEMWRTVASGCEWKGDVYNKKKNGELFWEKVAIFPIKTADGRITHFIEVKEDITRQREYEERLLRQANFDGLTGLPNRILIFDRLSQALENAKRRGENVAVLFIDIDNFTMINDTVGHAKGEEVLVETARRLAPIIRRTDTLGRFGDDEFLVILTGVKTKTSVEIIAQKILDAFSMPFLLNEREVFVSVSVGISIAPDDTDEPHVLVRNADTAARQVKEAGGNNLRSFEPVMNEQITKRMRMRHALHHCLERRELTLAYQPIIDVSSEKMIGAEALLRWENPELGQVPPDQFIPLAEETGLIIPMAEWVLNAACRQAQSWRGSNGLCMLRLAVNISSRNLKAGGDLVKTVKSALEKSKFPPECLELEITERMLMEESMETKSVLSGLKGLGVRLSIDDFGTGYSALSYLKEFPFDTIKIDRSFVRGIEKDNKGNTVVKAIITMSHSVGLQVIGEGVETKEQLEVMRSFGCDFIQGFYFSKPLPADQFQEFIRSSAPPH